MPYYIDREKFKKTLEHKAEMAWGPPKQVFYDVAKMLTLIPSADVVEVVRCGACHYWVKTDNGGYCDNPDGLDNNTSPDAFCSSGERKKN